MLAGMLGGLLIGFGVMLMINKKENTIVIFEFKKSKSGYKNMNGRYSWTIGVASVLAGGGFFNRFAQSGNSTSAFAMAIVMGAVGLVVGFVIDFIKNYKNRDNIN